MLPGFPSTDRERLAGLWTQVQRPLRAPGRRSQRGLPHLHTVPRLRLADAVPVPSGVLQYLSAPTRLIIFFDDFLFTHTHNTHSLSLFGRPFSLTSDTWCPSTSTRTRISSVLLWGTPSGRGSNLAWRSAPTRCGASWWRTTMSTRTRCTGRTQRETC